MAVITRDKNTNRINGGFRSKVLFGSDDADGIDTVKMGVADASIIYGMLSDISAKKGRYALREAYSNAYDATLATGDMGRRIDIVIPSSPESDGLAKKLGDDVKTVRYVSVSDNGVGMSKDEVCRYFLQYGGSKKRDDGDVESIGSKGLGSKAPLAVSDAFTVRSTKDGVTTTALIERVPSSENQAKVTSERTGDDSGTTVIIPVSDESVLVEMREFAAELMANNTTANLYVNGERSSCGLPTKVGERGNGYIYIGEVPVSGSDGSVPMRVWEPYGDDIMSEFSFPTASRKMGLSLDLCGVRYELDECHENTKYNYYGSVAPKRNPIIISGQPGYLNFVPSRDEIKHDQARTDFIDAIREALSDYDMSAAASSMFVGDGLSSLRSWLLRARAESRSYSPKMTMRFSTGDETVTFSFPSKLTSVSLSYAGMSIDGTDVSGVIFPKDDNRHLWSFMEEPNDSGNAITYKTRLIRRCDDANRNGNGYSSKQGITSGCCRLDEVSVRDIFYSDETSQQFAGNAIIVCISGISSYDDVKSVVRNDCTYRRHISDGATGTVMYVMSADGHELDASETATLSSVGSVVNVSFDEFVSSCRCSAREAEPKRGSESVDVSNMTSTMLASVTPRKDADVSGIGMLVSGQWATRMRTIDSVGITHCALALGDFDTDDAQKLGMVLRLAVTNGIMPDTVTTVIIVKSASNKDIDALVSNGAVVLCDQRSGIKHHHGDVINALSHVGVSVSFAKVKRAYTRGTSVSVTVKARVSALHAIDEGLLAKARVFESESISSAIGARFIASTCDYDALDASGRATVDSINALLSDCGYDISGGWHREFDEFRDGTITISGKSDILCDIDVDGSPVAATVASYVAAIESARVVYAVISGAFGGASVSLDSDVVDGFRDMFGGAISERLSAVSSRANA